MRTNEESLEAAGSRLRTQFPATVFLSATDEVAIPSVSVCSAAPGILGRRAFEAETVRRVA